MNSRNIAINQQALYRTYNKLENNTDSKFEDFKLS